VLRRPLYLNEANLNSWILGMILWASVDSGFSSLENLTLNSDIPTLWKQA
jgi:hypothetical protein